MIAIGQFGLFSIRRIRFHITNEIAVPFEFNEIIRVGFQFSGNSQIISVIFMIIIFDTDIILTVINTISA